MKKPVLLLALALLVRVAALGQATPNPAKPLAMPDSALAGKPLATPGEIYLPITNGSRLRITFLNQVWLMGVHNNPGTIVSGQREEYTAALALRRTRMQIFGNLSPRTFIYFQFGQNNVSAASLNAGTSRVIPFIHDAVCEYMVSPRLKLGGGLTIINGLSRFSQPSIGSIMTTDVPVFLQSTIDQTDQFNRRLSVYARGQVGRLDYRVGMANPFHGRSTIPGRYAEFSPMGNTWEQDLYLAFNFLDMEPNVTPYMAGTYLGKKRVWNIGFGLRHENRAMWRLRNPGSSTPDTVYEPLLHLGLETYLDKPVGQRGAAISAFAGVYHLDYGSGYVRFNGLVNPASNGPQFGNGYAMYATGDYAYAQLGYLLPHAEGATMWLPYVSATLENARRSTGTVGVYNAGVSYLINGHSAKLSLDLSNRPVYKTRADGQLEPTARRMQAVLQYQLFF